MSALAFNKKLLVAAHRAGDWKEAALLSQQRAELKASQQAHCRVCGVKITSTRTRPSKSGQCRICLNFERHHARRLPVISALCFLLSALPL
jgi:predicted nucleic acid-binding Zn ribbon protein